MNGNGKYDTLFLRDVHVFGKHGVYENERAVEQEFVIDIAAKIDAKTAGASDALTDTVDYATWLSAIEDVMRNHSYYLVEKISEEIADRVLQNERVYEVSVTVTKPTVFTSGVPGITITRTRD